MTTELPDPLVPAEVDLRDFQYMELDVQLLRDSKFAAEVDPEAFRAGVLLWCASWHQVPAGSLPDNDVELSNLAGFGRVVKEWRKVRVEALALFVRCSDGRLYHPVIAEKAVAAWESRLRHHFSKLLERMRKENKKRTDEKLEAIPYPTFEDWNSARLASGIPPEKSDSSAGITRPTSKPSAGIPPENALRGNGEGTERERNGDLLKETLPVGSDAAGVPPASPPAAEPAEIIFGYGVPLLTAAGSTDKAARSFLGGLRKAHGDVEVVDALRGCLKAKPLQPIEWLAAALPPPAAPGKPEAEAKRRAATDAEAKRQLGFADERTIDA